MIQPSKASSSLEILAPQDYFNEVCDNSMEGGAAPAHSPADLYTYCGGLAQRRGNSRRLQEGSCSNCESVPTHSLYKTAAVVPALTFPSHNITVLF